MRIGARAGRAKQELMVDSVVEQYVRWREECVAVAKSYANWGFAAPGEYRLAFAAHVAAIDREEKAAAVYRQSLERAVAH
jgi:surface-anchored protein